MTKVEINKEVLKFLNKRIAQNRLTRNMICIAFKSNSARINEMFETGLATQYMSDKLLKYCLKLQEQEKKHSEKAKSLRA